MVLYPFLYSSIGYQVGSEEELVGGSNPIGVSEFPIGISVMVYYLPKYRQSLK